MCGSRFSIVSPSVAPGSHLVVLRQTESTCRPARMRIGDRCFFIFCIYGMLPWFERKLNVPGGISMGNQSKLVGLFLLGVVIWVGLIAVDIVLRYDS